MAVDWHWQQDCDFRFTSFVAERLARAAPPSSGKLGRTRWEISGALPLGVTWDEHKALLNSWRPFRNFTYAVFTPGAETRYFSSSGDPVFDAQGGFAGYRGTTKDVTEQFSAGRRQRDLAVMVKAAAAMGRLGAWSVEIPGMQITWCDQVRMIHGVSADFACTVQSAMDFYAPEHRAVVRDALSECIRTGAPMDLEAQIITRAQRRVWVKIIGEAERDAAGRIVRIYGAFQDITKSKEATEAAKVMAENMAATLDSLTDGFYVLDREWRFRYLNQVAKEVLQCRSESLVGKSIWDVFPEAVGTRIQAVLEEVMSERVAQEFEDYFPPLGLWFRARVCPAPDGIVVSFSDITAQRIAEADLIRSNSDLEEKIRERTVELETATREMEALAYAVAHDLRAPLSALTGYSQMLEQSHMHEMSGKGPHYVRRIRAAATQMDEMTDGLLALAHLAGREIHRQDVDLSALVQELAAQKKALQPDREATFHIQQDMKVDADRVLLTRVFDNLIGNSWKFASLDRPTKIEVGQIRSDDGEPIYFVKDNGVGFDSDYASRLFRPFQRLHSTAEFSGTGIGLAIVQKAVRLHGGHIWGESSPGEGACFYFTLGPHDKPKPRTRDLFSDQLPEVRNPGAGQTGASL